VAATVVTRTEVWLALNISMTRRDDSRMERVTSSLPFSWPGLVERRSSSDEGSSTERPHSPALVSPPRLDHSAACSREAVSTAASADGAKTITRGRSV